MEIKIKRLVSDTMVFAIGNASTKLILFLLMPLYTTALTTAEYGISDTLNVLVELMLPIGTLCIAEAVFRFSIDDDCDKSLLFSMGFFTILKSILILSAVALIAQFLFHYQYAVYLLLMYIAYCLRQLFGYFLRGVGMVKRFTVCGVIGTVFLILFNLLFLMVWHMGIDGYLLSIIFSNMIAAILMFISGGLHRNLVLGGSDKKLSRDTLKYSAAMIPNSISWWINSAASKYIILFLQGPAVTGLYSAAGKLPALINVISSIFQQAWQYSSAKEYDNENKDRFYSTVFNYYSSFILIASSGAVLISPIISKIILRGDFYEAQKFVPLMLFSAALLCYSTFFGGFYTASKQNKMLMISTIISSAINLVISFLLTPAWGAFGAVVATIICYAFVSIFRIIDTRKFTKIKTNWVLNALSLIILLAQSLFMTITETGLNTYFISGAFFFAVLLINAIYLLMRRKGKRVQAG